MRKIGFEIKNYKKIKELNVPLSECDVVIVSGKNRDGKSSLINGIFENLTLKNLSDEPLARGANSGEKSVIIQDKNGKEIKIVHTFEKKSPRGSFYAVQDGKKISSVEKIRELIGECNKYTIYDFFVMCRSTDGRRKFISEILMKMLSKEQSDRIEEINNEINTKNGFTYIKRRDANRALDTLKNTPMLSKEEEATLAKEDFYKAVVKETNDTVTLAEKNLALVESINTYIYNIPGSGLSSSLTKEQITFKNEELKTLLISILSSEEQMIAYKDSFIAQSTKIKQMISDAKNNESYKTAVQALLNIENLKQVKDRFAGIKGQITTLEKEIEGLNNKLSKMSEEKDKILSESNLPEGLVIESESEFTYNGFNFSETEISESEAQLLLAKLTIPIYDGPYFRMGNADIYGKDALKELSELAATHGKILAMERVNDDLNEVFVECSVYDEDIAVTNEILNQKNLPEQKLDATPVEDICTVSEVVVTEKANDIMDMDITKTVVDVPTESTGNKLLREAEERRKVEKDARKNEMVNQFVKDAEARGIVFDDDKNKNIDPLNIDFSKEAEAYDNGEVINTAEVTTQVEKKEEPVKEKPINPVFNDSDVKTLTDLF